jgi:hypothetical protein
MTKLEIKGDWKIIKGTGRSSRASWRKSMAEFRSARARPARRLKKRSRSLTPVAAP